MINANIGAGNYPRCYVDFYAKRDTDFALDYSVELYRRKLKDGTEREAARAWIQGICIELIDADGLQRAVAEFDLKIRDSVFRTAIDERNADEEETYWLKFCNEVKR